MKTTILLQSRDKEDAYSTECTSRWLLCCQFTVSTSLHCYAGYQGLCSCAMVFSYLDEPRESPSIRIRFEIWSYISSNFASHLDQRRLHTMAAKWDQKSMKANRAVSLELDAAYHSSLPLNRRPIMTTLRELPWRTSAVRSSISLLDWVNFLPRIYQHAGENIAPLPSMVRSAEIQGFRPCP